MLSLSTPIPNWLNRACQEWLQDPSTTQLIHRIQTDPNPPQGYSWMDNTIKYKGRLVLLPTYTLNMPIFHELHSSAIAGHSSFQKTYAHARCSFFSLGMKKDIYSFISKCDICQCHKGELIKPPGTLQPLPIPTSIWIAISMDFIVGFPKAGNKSIIMVVADRFSKYAHLCSLQQQFTLAMVAQLYLDQIFKLHAMPTSIVSDMDPTFTSKFLQVQTSRDSVENDLFLSSIYIWENRGS